MTVLTVKLNGNREVSGVLRGFDVFMNLVMDNANEHQGDQIVPIGTVV